MVPYNDSIRTSEVEHENTYELRVCANEQTSNKRIGKVSEEVKRVQ